MASDKYLKNTFPTKHLASYERKIGSNTHTHIHTPPKETVEFYMIII